MSEEKIETVKYDFDPLKLYFAEDYEVTDRIIISQPTIGDIVEFGEENIEASIRPFVTNSTTHRVWLWDKGLDWNKISDYQLFYILYRTLTPDVTSLLFGDFDFQELDAYEDPDGNIEYYDKNQDLVINEDIFTNISQYIRFMFDRHPKVEKAKGRITKEAIIDEERMNIELEMKKHADDSMSSRYLPLISAMLNHPGFKYNKKQLREVGLVEFMDSVKRLSVYEQCHAFLGGMYSGFMDTSKMSKDDFNKSVNWLRDLYS